MDTSPGTPNQRRRWRMRPRVLLTVGAAGASLLGLTMLSPLAPALADGGSTASWGNYWAVGRIQTQAGNRCTGTLIDTHVLLTAAHCDVGPGSTVTFGEFSGSGVSTIQGTVSEADNAPGSVDLTLAKVDYNESNGITTVFPPNPQTVNYSFQGDGTPITDVGYGYTDYGNNSSWQLARYQVQATGEIASYGTFGSLPGNRYILSGLTVCKGDSGGPIMVDNEVVGVATNINGDTDGGSCGTQSTALPVSNFASWIQSTADTLQNDGN